MPFLNGNNGSATNTDDHGRGYMRRKRAEKRALARAGRRERDAYTQLLASRAIADRVNRQRLQLRFQRTHDAYLMDDIRTQSTLRNYRRRNHALPEPTAERRRVLWELQRTVARSRGQRGSSAHPCALLDHRVRCSRDLLRDVSLAAHRRRGRIGGTLDPCIRLERRHHHAAHAIRGKEHYVRQHARSVLRRWFRKLLPKFKRLKTVELYFYTEYNCCAWPNFFWWHRKDRGIVVGRMTRSAKYPDHVRVYQGSHFWSGSPRTLIVHSRFTSKLSVQIDTKYYQQAIVEKPSGVIDLNASDSTIQALKRDNEHLVLNPVYGAREMQRIQDSVMAALQESYIHREMRSRAVDS